MSKNAPELSAMVSRSVPLRLWQSLSPVHQQSLVALLATCLLKQLAAQVSDSTRQEVKREPPACR